MPFRNKIITACMHQTSRSNVYSDYWYEPGQRAGFVCVAVIHKWCACIIELLMTDGEKKRFSVPCFFTNACLLYFSGASRKSDGWVGLGCCELAISVECRRECKQVNTILASERWRWSGGGNTVHGYCKAMLKKVKIL